MGKLVLNTLLKLASVTRFSSASFFALSYVEMLCHVHSIDESESNERTSKAIRISRNSFSMRVSKLTSLPDITLMFCQMFESIGLKIEPRTHVGSIHRRGSVLKG